VHAQGAAARREAPAAHAGQHAAAHPSSDVTGRAWKPKGLSLRQFLRSSARRERATPDIAPRPLVLLLLLPLPLRLPPLPQSAPRLV
jgi:hypothetical protein